MYEWNNVDWTIGRDASVISFASWKGEENGRTFYSVEYKKGRHGCKRGTIKGRALRLITVQYSTVLYKVRIVECSPRSKVNKSLRMGYRKATRATERPTIRRLSQK